MQPVSPSEVAHQREQRLGRRDDDGRRLEMMPTAAESAALGAHSQSAAAAPRLGIQAAGVRSSQAHRAAQASWRTYREARGRMSGRGPGHFWPRCVTAACSCAYCASAETEPLSTQTRRVPCHGHSCSTTEPICSASSREGTTTSSWLGRPAFGLGLGLELGQLAECAAATSAPSAGPQGRTAGSHWRLSGSAARPECVAQPRAQGASGGATKTARRTCRASCYAAC